MSKSTKTSKKRGRPKKNADLDFANLSLSVNVNQKNEYPPNNIILSKMATQLKDKDYEMILRYDKAKVFETLLKGYKSKQKNINIIFTSSGMIFNHNMDDKDQVRFECKIFPDNLLEYGLKDLKKEIIIKVEIDTLHKILKSVPKNHEFSFEMYDGKKDRTFRVVTKDPIRNKYDDKQITISPITHYNIITFKDDKLYDTIIMFEAEEFNKICKNIKLFSTTFTINVYKNNLRVVFEYNKDKTLTCYSVLYPSKKCIFIQKPNTDIKNKYNLTSFIKYTESYKCSNVVKLYVSLDKPLIIEYPVEPGLGVFQIFVQSQ